MKKKVTIYYPSVITLSQARLFCFDLPFNSQLCNNIMITVEYRFSDDGSVADYLAWAAADGFGKIRVLVADGCVAAKDGYQNVVNMISQELMASEEFIENVTHVWWTAENHLKLEK